MSSEPPTDTNPDSPPTEPLSEKNPAEESRPETPSTGTPPSGGGSPSDRRSSSAPARPAIALPAGTVLRDEYRVEEVLDTGSFGVTYRAADRHLQASVAIKEYFPRQLATRVGSTLTLRARSSDATDGFEEGLQRFMEEGRFPNGGCTIGPFGYPHGGYVAPRRGAEDTCWGEAIWTGSGAAGGR